MTQPYSVKIAGAAITTVAGSLQADLAIGKTGTAQFTVKQPDTSTHYQQYQTVQVFDQNGAVIFGGYIQTPKEMKPGFPSYLTNQVVCMDYRWISDKRLIFTSNLYPDVTLYPSTILYPASTTGAKIYTNRPYDVIAMDIFNTILKQEGVTMGAIFTGPPPSPTLYPSTTLYPNGAAQSISSVTFNFPTATQALGALVKSASDSGVAFYWSIDQNKQFWFVPYSYVVNSTVVDGTTIDDGHASGQAPYVTRANPLYRNTQYVTGGHPPGTISAQNASQVTAQAALDGTSGIVESVVSDTNIMSGTDGVIEANQLLNVYSTSGLTFVFTTRTAGYVPGQQITVTYAPFGFSSTKMLVTGVHIDDSIDGFNIWYTVTAVVGPYDVTWAQFFGKLLAPRGVASASAISIGI